MRSSWMLLATANCQSVLQLDAGTWRQVSPGNFLCAPLIDSGTGR